MSACPSGPCLTVFISVPPTKAELVGHISGAELSVKEEEEVELKCVIHNARPRPDIIWYLGDREFVSGMSAICLSIGSCSRRRVFDPLSSHRSSVSREL